MSETKKIGNYRYRILGLLMFATTINYFDRSIIGVMAPTLENMFGWTNGDYANRFSEKAPKRRFGKESVRVKNVSDDFVTSR